MPSAATKTATRKPHLVDIAVNEHPVSIEGPKATGLEIKQAAIDQGVDIQLDFILSVELGGGRTKIVGSTDTITVHKGLHFVAIPDDDNS